MIRLFEWIQRAFGPSSRKNRGETITEALVSILVGGLALLMLATVIATATNIVGTTRHSMDDYVAQNNYVVESSGSFSATGSATLKSGSGGSEISIRLSDDGEGSSLTGYYAPDGENARIVTYKKRED